MNNTEMLRIIESIARDRNVDRDLLIEDLETAMVTAARKHYQTLDTEEFACHIDRLTGEMAMTRHGEEMDLSPAELVLAEPLDHDLLEGLGRDSAELGG
ncbi:MAG: NusA N-terminal domain-containing protein, partial [Planctomycetota bacterium]